MSTRKPLIAYTMFMSEDEPGYDVYTDAYGLEMSFDDEWNLDAVIVVPADYLSVLSSETDIESMGIGIGTSSCPTADEPLKTAKWFVLSLDNGECDIEAIQNRKLIAVSSDLAKIKLFTDTAGKSESPLAAIALPFSSVENIEKQAVQVRGLLDDSQLTDVRIIVFVESDDVDLGEIINIDQVDGFYHSSSGYEELLDLMEEVGSND